MKKLTLLINIVILSVAGIVNARQVKSKNTIDIQDVRKTQQPVPDPANHKNHDVEAYRTNNNESTYTVSFYIKTNDSLRYCAINYGTKGDMDKVAYKWLDDTLLSLRLYNSVTKKEVKLKASGSRSGTKMWIDE